MQHILTSLIASSNAVPLASLDGPAMFCAASELVCIVQYSSTSSNITQLNIYYSMLDGLMSVLDLNRAPDHRTMATRTSKGKFFLFPKSNSWNTTPPDASIPMVSSITVDVQTSPSPCMIIKEFDAQFRHHGLLGIRFVTPFREMLYCKTDCLEFHNQFMKSSGHQHSQVSPLIRVPEQH
jgi:hypothetical protein